MQQVEAAGLLHISMLSSPVTTGKQCKSESIVFVIANTVVSARIAILEALCMLNDIFINQ